jgi:hypothetical protein
MRSARGSWQRDVAPPQDVTPEALAEVPARRDRIKKYRPARWAKVAASAGEKTGTAQTSLGLGKGGQSITIVFQD